jgi:hypothetical protein
VLKKLVKLRIVSISKQSWTISSSVWHNTLGDIQMTLSRSFHLMDEFQTG